MIEYNSVILFISTLNTHFILEIQCINQVCL